MAIDAERRAMIVLQLDPGGIDPGIDEARRKIRAFEDGIRRDEKKRRGKSASGAIAGFVGGMTSSFTSGAMSFVADSARDVMDVERSLTRLQIAAGRTPAEMEGFRAKMSEVSQATGIARGELVAGAAAYTALTGDAAGAETAMGMFAKVANASGASMADIAKTAAAMKDNLGIEPKDFQAGFDVLITQGKAGAIELNELATLLAGLAPSFAQFKGGGGAKGLADLGAAFQVARKGFGSAAEAATGVRALMVSINRNAKKFQDAGVKIFQKNPRTGKKELRGFNDILTSIDKKQFDSTKLFELFGSDEAKRAYDQQIANRDLARQLSTESQGSNAVEKDHQKWMESSAGRMQTAWNSLRESIANALTPERIEAFAKVMERVVGLAGDAAKIFEGWLTGNSPIQRGIRKYLGYSTEDDDVYYGLAETKAARTDELVKRGLHTAGATDQIATEDAILEQLGRGEKSTGEWYKLSDLAAFRDIMNQEGRVSTVARNMFNQQYASYIGKIMAREMKLAQDLITVQIGNETVKTEVKDAKSGRATPGAKR